MNWTDTALTLIGTYWPFLVVVLATAAAVEAVKRSSRAIFRVLGWQRGRAVFDAFLRILPETVCALACVLAPIFDPPLHWLIAACLGVLGGSLASRLYDLVLKRILAIAGRILDRASPPEAQP